MALRSRRARERCRSRAADAIDFSELKSRWKLEVIEEPDRAPG